MKQSNTKCTSCNFGSCALETLGKEELLKMENNALQSSFKEGEILRNQGSPLHSIIYSRKGYIKELIRHEKSSDQVIQIIKPKSYIGLQSLYTDQSSTFTYQAITDVEICYINKSAFTSLIEGNGSFAREILISLSNESFSNQNRFLSLNQKQTYGKVAGLILYLSSEIYESKNFPVHLTRSELAQMIGSTRESVTRALKWFSDEKMIELNKNQLKIINENRITQISKSG